MERPPVSAYNETPQTLDELEASLTEYRRLLDQHRKQLATWVQNGGDPDDEEAPQKPMGPILTSTAMLELIGVVLSIREWLNSKTEWPA